MRKRIRNRAMKKILFRSWNIIDKCFYYFENGTYYYFGERGSKIIVEEFVFNWKSAQQFTGLLDKSGNEIFENDKVLYDGVLGNVFYNKDLAMFMVRFDYTNSVYNFDNLDREIEIIGNIHEENK